MKDAQWLRTYALCEALSEVPAAERRGCLEASGAEPDIAAEVLGLLERAQEPVPALNICGAGKPGFEGEPAARITIGRYVITGLLGRGATGDVYSACDEGNSRTVALKVLNEQITDRPSPANCFVREAGIASALHHPNIVTIYEVMERGGKAAIAMELIEGRPLREFCGKPLTLELVIYWARQMAEALGAAHAKGVIHCDIKPENIMVRPDGLIKLLDFGMAHYLTGGDTVRTDGLPVGTLRYMAPEQARGEALTRETDIFSLGLVLYELSTGCHPFATDSSLASAYSIAARQPTAPSFFNGEIPARLEWLILSMLAKNPRARPSADGAARILAALCQNTMAREAAPTKGETAYLLSAAEKSQERTLATRLRFFGTEENPLPVQKTRKEPVQPPLSVVKEIATASDHPEIEPGAKPI